MMVDTLRWRSTKGVYEIVSKGESDINRLLLNAGKTYLGGLDKEGRIVFYIHAKLHDKNMGTAEDNENFTILLIEIARRLATPGVETANVIFDLTGSGYSNMDLPNVKFLVNCFQNHYPENLGKCFIYNAPWIFSAFWKLIKPLLDPVVASKIVFINSKDDLLKYMDENVVLAEMGGKNYFTYDFEHGLKMDPMKLDISLERGPETKLKIQHVKSEFLYRKRELVDITKKLAETLRSVDTEEDLDALVNSEHFKELQIKRNAAKRKFYECSKELRTLTEPPHLYHRIGVVDDKGKLHWDQLPKKRHSSRT
jgi:hypothetical protein